MLNIGNKTFMNMQEAVGWLLENNALPFQSTANYVANTEIAMSTLVNPSPAKVRVGSLIFFADSKVSTVVGVTSNSFIVSDQYNDLVDDVVYVSNVALNASAHLIVTLSNGTDIDAGLIKEVSYFSIDASQHLIANYNDGTTTDLGAIFTGNVSISGNLAVSGNITGANITENMSGYVARVMTGVYGSDISNVYTSVVKNGNKLTIVFFFSFTKRSGYGAGEAYQLVIPNDVGNKLYPYTVGTNDKVLDLRSIDAVDVTDRYSTYNVIVDIYKAAANNLYMQLLNISSLTNDKTYLMRYECTFLLSDDLTQ